MAKIIGESGHDWGISVRKMQKAADIPRPLPHILVTSKLTHHRKIASLMPGVALG